MDETTRYNAIEAMQWILRLRKRPMQPESQASQYILYGINLIVCTAAACAHGHAQAGRSESCETAPGEEIHPGAARGGMRRDAAVCQRYRTRPAQSYDREHLSSRDRARRQSCRSRHA